MQSKLSSFGVQVRICQDIITACQCGDVTTLESHSEFLKSQPAADAQLTTSLQYVTALDRAAIKSPLSIAIFNGKWDCVNLLCKIQADSIRSEQITSLHRERQAPIFFGLYFSAYIFRPIFFGLSLYFSLPIFLSLYFFAYISLPIFPSFGKCLAGVLSRVLSSLSLSTSINDFNKQHVNTLLMPYKHTAHSEDSQERIPDAQRNSSSHSHQTQHLSSSCPLEPHTASKIHEKR